jgi:hypothetical protein
MCTTTKAVRLQPSQCAYYQYCAHAGRDPHLEAECQRSVKWAKTAA